MGVRIVPWDGGNFKGKAVAHCKVYGLYAVSGAKTAEPTEMPLGMWTRRSNEACIRLGAPWRHLSNVTEPSVCGGDAAFCQVTLTTCKRFFRTAHLAYGENLPRRVNCSPDTTINDLT